MGKKTFKILNLIFFVFLLTFCFSNSANAYEKADISSKNIHLTNFAQQKYDISLPKENLVYTAQNNHNDFSGMSFDVLLPNLNNISNIRKFYKDKSKYNFENSINLIKTSYCLIPRAP